ncbi:hypothetical protein POSPLADRAFT_1031668 [Postia placenta MAD-698-R-SB12]|uniref:Amine oxidase n=1 Tax=Postia placenta MAD-698-R-SB12 TaxID=670580 RepID=A0A1X6N878_9APHY|nr:hypothetical protein POSPLADRAFT_1031668 [Postia placenta MAD-698-R-SB12]OSX64593.1 hypothetical protein POSPLADRAFT_1031668 [Postia placenta MAD-698-R-SB12]
MRATTAAPALLLAAAIAPSMAAPIASSSEAELLTRRIDFTTPIHPMTPATARAKLLSWMKREDQELPARAIEDELIARAGFQMRPVSTTWTYPGPQGRIVTVVTHPPRSFDEELYARAAPPAAGSEAVNWKKVGNVAGKVAGAVGKVLAFLKREDQELLARAIEDEVIARELLRPGPISFIPMNPGLPWTKGRIGTVVNPPRSFDDDELMARSFGDDELYARSGFVLDELD